MRGDGLKLSHGKVRLDTRKNFFSKRCALTQTAQGVVGSPSLDLWRCGTEGHCQWAWWSGLGLDLVILEAFSNLSDSVTRGDLGLPEEYDDGLNLL